MPLLLPDKEVEVEGVLPTTAPENKAARERPKCLPYHTLRPLGVKLDLFSVPYSESDAKFDPEECCVMSMEVGCWLSSLHPKLNTDCPWVGPGAENLR